MGRRPCCDKVGLKKGRWTSEEDEILTKYIQANGEGSWRSLPKNAGLLRCGKSCRLRWINYLRSDLKRGNISSEEEDMIIKLHSSLGNRWSLIASQLSGRTDNEIKNYWNSHLSRKITTFRRSSSESALPLIMDVTSRVNLTKNQKTEKASQSCQTKKTKSKDAPEQKGNLVNEHIPLPSTPELEKESLLPLPPTPGMEREDDDMEMDDPQITTDDDKGKTDIASEEERARENSMQCLNGEEKESEREEGPSEEGSNGGVMWYNEPLDNGSLDLDGILTLVEERKNDCEVINEERESGDLCSDRLATANEEVESGNFSSVNGGEWYSCLSLGSSFEESGVDNWEWDNVADQSNELWDESETMLSRLWDADEIGEIDPNKQSAVIAWLLS